MFYHCAMYNAMLSVSQEKSGNCSHNFLRVRPILFLVAMNFSLDQSWGIESVSQNFKEDDGKTRMGS